MPGQCKSICLQNTALKIEFPPKRAKTEPRGCKIIKIWPYMAPKGTQFELKGHQNEPKGCQRGAKSEPEIRRHRPVSGVSDKRSQMAKRRLRRLALLTPRGPTFGTFVAHFGVIFGIKFWHHFWHAFFPVFLRFLADFGSHFGSLLASFSIILACLFRA